MHGSWVWFYTVLAQSGIRRYVDVGVSAGILCALHKGVVSESRVDGVRVVQSGKGRQRVQNTQQH